MSWYEALDQWTADYLPDMTYEHDAPLSVYRHEQHLLVLHPLSP